MSKTPEASNFYTPEARQTISNNVGKISRALGTDLVVPSRIDELFTVSPRTIARDHKVRWQIYRDVTRSARNGEPLPENFDFLTGRLQMLNNLDTYIQNHVSGEKRVLRDRQMSVFEALRADLESGRVEDQGYFRLPVRWGKTVLFSEFIKATGVRTLVVAPTLLTSLQAADTLTETEGETMDVGRVFGGKKQRGRHVEVTTYASWLRDLKTGRIDPEAYDLLILDEAHLALSERRVDAMKQFKRALKLGFTATPKYSDNKQVGNVLSPLIYDMTQRQGIAEGLLAPLSVYEVRTTTDLSKIKIDFDGDYDEKALAKAVNIESRNEAVVDVYQRKFLGQRTLVFCAGVEHAQKMAEKFDSLGIPGVHAEVISGQNTIDQQRDIKTRFKEGETSILCSADLLVFGYDEPRIETVIRARPSLSPVLIEQIGGRALTLSSENPKKRASVVDIIDSDNRGLRYADIVQEHAQSVVAYPYSANAKRKTRERSYEAARVGGIDVQTFIREVLTLLEESRNKEFLRETASFSIGSLTQLLGKPGHVIARRLPNYFKGGLAGRQGELILANMKKLSENNSETAVKLYPDIIKTMLVDSIYERVDGKRLFRQIPEVTDQLQQHLQKAMFVLPEIKDQVSLLVMLGITARDLHSAGNEESPELVEGFMREFDKLSQICDRARANTKDPESLTANAAIHSFRKFYIEFRDDPLKKIKRRRIRRFIDEQPELILDFSQAKDEYKETSLYAEMQDIMEDEQIKSAVESVRQSILMNTGFAENTESYLQATLARIPKSMQSKVLDRYVESYRHFNNYREQAQKTGQPVSQISTYQHFDRVIHNFLREVTTAVDLHNQSAIPLLSEEENKALQNTRIFLVDYFTNIDVINSETIKALGNNPGVIRELLSVSSGNQDIIRTQLVVNIYANGKFKKLKGYKAAA